MGTVYVDADAFLDAVVYGAGDTITIRYGAILTQRESNTTQPFQITSTDSTFKITSAYRKLVLAAGGYVNCVAGDVGKTVVGATTGDTGTLVSYDNGTRTWWVLRTDPDDDQFDNASENLSITSGTGAGSLSALPGQAVICKFSSTNNSGMVFSQSAKLVTEGSWYPLGTGNGAGGQTFTFYGSEACPYVQVETGSGTGVFTDCRCVYNTALSSYGAGVYLGNVFRHAPDDSIPISSITFGDGTNGIAPANGAKVRCPDIYITSAMNYTATVTNRSRTYYSGNGGRHDYRNVIFSDRYYHAINYVEDLQLLYVGLFAPITLQYIPSADINHYVQSKDRAVTGSNASYFVGIQTGTIQNVSAEVYGTPGSGAGHNWAFRLSASSDVSMSNIQCVTTQRGTAAYSFSLMLDNCAAVTLSSVYLIGGFAYITNCLSGPYIENVYFSDSSNCAKSTLQGISAMYFNNTGRFKLDGLELIPGGDAPYTYAVYTQGTPEGAVIQHVEFDMDNRTQYLIGNVGISRDLLIANCNMTGTTRSGHINVGVATVRTAARNLMFAAATSAGATQGNAIRIEGLVSGATGVTMTSVRDSMYQLIYDSSAKTSGYICLTFTPENTLEYFNLLSGNPDTSIYFNFSGRLYMKTNGDSCTYEIPYLIQGVDSFQNSAPTILHATWAANCTKEYAIKSGTYGSSWGVWTALTGANLAAETVDSETGFYMKFRFTMTGSSASNYVERFMIPVNTDAAFSFPVGYVPITISGMVEDSVYRVWDNTNARWLGQGIADATGAVTIDGPCDFDGADISITVRVRKGDAAPFYDPWELTTTYSDDGVTVPVAQKATTVQTDVGEAFFSFDAVNKIGEIADSETTVTVQEVVNAFREWETQHPEEDQLLETEGKGVLGAGLYTGILCRLINDWRLRFESRAGPAWVNCSILAGDLIADNSYGDDPIAPAAYVNVTRAIATSAALLDGGGSGLTAQEVRDAMKLAPSAGAPAAGSIDDLISDVGTAVGGLNDVSSSDVQAAAAAALTAYDPPTKTELDSAVSPLATSVALATVDGIVDSILADTAAIDGRLPSDPADQSAVEAAITAATSPLATSGALALVAADVTTIKKVETGRWKITGNQMIFYDTDGVTPILTFDLLDDSGLPAMENVYERDPA